MNNGPKQSILVLVDDLSLKSMLPEVLSRAGYVATC